MEVQCERAGVLCGISSKVFSALLIAAAIGLGGSEAAQATEITAFGSPVTGIASNTSSGSLNANHFLEFFIPLSQQTSGTYGVNSVGTYSDTGAGGGSLDLFLNFGVISQPLTNVQLTFDFIDLDLSPVNDPTGFLETVRFFGPQNTTITIDNLNDDVAGFFSVTGNNDTQTITFSNISSLLSLSTSNPFIVGLHFTTIHNAALFGGNTSESVRGTLRGSTTGQAVPEPTTLLLMGSGLFAFGRRRKLHD